MRLGNMSPFLSLLLCLSVVAATPLEESSHNERDSKFLNLQLLPFVTVNVDPSQCTGKSDNSSMGTCTTKADCQKEGRADGPCANGYGVCCIFEKRCGATVTKNMTYLVNDAYPDALEDIGNCQYNIQKAADDVCQLRLDFMTLKLQGPDNTSSCVTDTFTFVGTAGANPTVICGENNGQHMYLDLAEGNGAARINIATTDKSTERSWKIKVTQIPCSSPRRAPPSCLQYFTEYSGNIRSFNYMNTGETAQLADQRYTVCIQTREGFCGIKYIADDFSLSGDATDTPEAMTGGKKCNEDFVLIPSLNKDGTVSDFDRYCGTDFDDLTTYSQPFEIRVVTSTDEPAAKNETDNKGFDLRYTQIPC